MNSKQLAVTSAIVLAVLAVIIVLLVTGGPPSGADAADPKNDVEVGEGGDPPVDSGVADVIETRVYSDGGQIVFEATMAQELPKALKDGTMEWRWEVLEGGSETWLVTANVSVGDPIGSITAEQRNYGASTIDETLPGRLEYDGRTIAVRLDQPDIKHFPTEFAWRLETSLDANRADPASALATDLAPESGLGEYPPPEQRS